MKDGNKLLPLILVFYLATPIYPIPIIGVSLSLPLILVLALKNWRLHIPRSTPLTILLIILVIALILSLSVNILSGDLINDAQASLIYILQFCFYSIAATLGYRLFLHPVFPSKAARIFALGVMTMSVFIVSENVFFGSLNSTGGWSRLTRMSQNSYAVQFSSYLPFVYYAVVTSRTTTNRIMWIVIASFCLFAVMANGSRTAWITTLITMSLFLGLYSFSLRKYKAIAITLLLAPTILLAGWIALPDTLKESLERDFSTYENLEGDKSWMIRQLQIQKSMKIFEESPWFGVGPAQFKNQLIALDMPDVLAGRSAHQFSNVSAHNSYIQFLSESGMIFIIPFIIMLAWLLIIGTRASIYLARNGEVWALALLSGLIGLSIHFWTISGLTTTGPWFLYGAMASVITRAKHSQRKFVLSNNIRLGHAL